MKRLLLLTTLQLAICFGVNAQGNSNKEASWAQLVAADGSGDTLLWVLASLSGAVPPSGLYFQRIERRANQLSIWGQVEGGANLTALVTNLRSLNWVEAAEIAASDQVPPPSQGAVPGRSRFEITVQVKPPERSATMQPVEPVPVERPRALVAAAELDTVANDLIHALLANRLHADRFLAQAVEHSEYSEVQPYSLKLVGYFGGVVGFLDQITSLPRLVAISCSNWEAIGSEIKVDCRAEIHMRRVDSQPQGGRRIRKRGSSMRAIIEAAKAGSSNPFDSARIVAMCPPTVFDSQAVNSTSGEPTEGFSVVAVFDRSGGRQALVKTDAPQLRALKVGDILGYKGGRVASIAHDEVVVAERCKGHDGIILDRRIRLPVKK